MKKFLIAAAIIFASKVGMAQTVYTDSTLNTMTKMQLTKVYLDQVTTLAFSAPYTPFTVGVNDSIHGELDIPVSRYTSKKREKIMEMSKAYGELMEEKLYELVPYSDKKDIIRAILFLQETNSNIKVISK
jgi:hypothetical protein